MASTALRPSPPPKNEWTLGQRVRYPARIRVVYDDNPNGPGRTRTWKRVEGTPGEGILVRIKVGYDGLITDEQETDLMGWSPPTSTRVWTPQKRHQIAIVVRGLNRDGVEVFLDDLEAI